MVSDMRRGELIANLLIAGGPILLMGIMFWSFFVVSIVASAPTVLYYISIVLFAMGFLMFLRAKWSMIVKGKFISFGSSQMTKFNRYLYLWGYTIMAVGAVICFILAQLVKHKVIN
jgi:hypothetical protein